MFPRERKSEKEGEMIDRNCCDAVAYKAAGLHINYCNSIDTSGELCLVHTN